MSENIWKISGISVRPENVPKRDRFRHPGNVQKVSGNRPESVQKTRFLPDLWNAISQDPVIGFMRFWTYLKALVLLYLCIKFQIDWLNTREVISV